MKRQTIIVVVSSEGSEVETFGNFKKMCEIKGFPYHSLKANKLPIVYNNYTIHRTKFI